VAERALPNNLEAERAVLGAILMNNEGFGIARGILVAEDFFRDAHRRIIRAMDRVLRADTVLDLVTLKDELLKGGELDEVGGPVYLAGLVDGVPRSTNVVHYAQIVKRLSGQRTIIHVANAALVKAYEADASPEEIRASTVQTLSHLVTTGSPKRARNFEMLGEQRYSLKVDPLGIIFDIDRLRRERGELHGELQVRVNGAFPQAKTIDGVLSMADFNMSASRSRTERAKLLEQRSSATEVDWFGLLEEFCIKVLATERAGQPAVLLSDIEEEDAEADSWDVLGVPVLKTLPMMVYGDGGTAKSYIALLIAGTLTKQDIPVLYCDWEFDAKEHKKRLARLFQPMPSVYYLRCDRPMCDEAERIARVVKLHGIQYVICDSVAFACDGRPEEAEQAGSYFRALRQFGVGSLNIAHVTKMQEEGKVADKPFGSVFWWNGVRSLWSIQKAEDNPPGELRIGLYHRKSNTRGLMTPRAYILHFETYKTWFEPTKVQDVDELAAKLPLHERMRRLLAKGALPAKEVAESLGVTHPIIRATVSRHSKTFIKLGNKIGLMSGSQEF
jgi:hypothetical protein